LLLAAVAAVVVRLEMVAVAEAVVKLYNSF
jgi:hypothetical protein